MYLETKMNFLCQGFQKLEHDMHDIASYVSTCWLFSFSLSVSVSLSLYLYICTSCTISIIIITGRQTHRQMRLETLPRRLRGWSIQDLATIVGPPRNTSTRRSLNPSDVRSIDAWSAYNYPPHATELEELLALCLITNIGHPLSTGWPMSPKLKEANGKTINRPYYSFGNGSEVYTNCKKTGVL